MVGDSTDVSLNTRTTETETETTTDILILGAGWTSTFLVPLLQEHNISFVATSRDGSERSGVPTIPFAFDPSSDDVEPFRGLPNAKTILVTFPVYKEGGYKRFVKLWKETHPGTDAGIVQLGSTGIYDVRCSPFRIYPIIKAYLRVDPHYIHLPTRQHRKDLFGQIDTLPLIHRTNVLVQRSSY